jgi:hypothetical protein
MLRWSPDVSGKAIMDERDEERIRQRAYGIWEREGRPQGRQDEHWFDAEREEADGSGDRPVPAGIPDGDAPPRGRVERATDAVDETYKGEEPAQGPDGYGADVETRVSEAERTFTPSTSGGQNIDVAAGERNEDA